MAREVIRMKAISDRTGQSVNTLHWLRARGEGPPMFKLGKNVVAYADEVDGWIERHANGPTATGRRAIA